MKVFEINLRGMLKNPKIWLALTALAAISISCDLEIDQDPTKVFIELEEDQKSITQHLEENEQRFSILNAIMDTTGLEHLFRTYGDYTFLAPTDSAFEAYFVKEGKSGLNDFTVEELDALLRYHIFKQNLLAGSFSEGLVESVTLSQDYMVSGPSLDGSDILLNKSSRIIAKDWLSANGTIHTVDKVIEKPELNMYEWLSTNGQFSIFTQGLEATGWDEFAQKLEKDNGSKEFSTLFVTPDSIYKKYNINSFDELVDVVAPGETDFTGDSSTVNAFIGSHFLTEVLSTSDAIDDQVFYGTKGGASIKFGLIPSTAHLVLNYGTIDFPDGLNVNEFYSNNLTENGVIHLMDTVYMVTQSFQRIRRSFVYLDVPGMPYDSLVEWTTYLVEELGITPKGGTNDDIDEDEYNQQWPRTDSGEDHIPFGRTNGWLTLNAPYSGLIKADFHRFNDFDNYRYEGNPTAYNPCFFTWEPCDDLLDVTRKLPYIIPGRYRLILEVKKGSNRPSIKNFFDGKEIGGIINLQTGNLGFEDMELGIVEIKENEETHTLRTQNLTTGKGFIVAVKFQPID